MPATPRHQLGDIAASDLGEQHILAKVVYQECKLPRCIVGAGMMLALLDPVTIGDVIEP